MELSEAGPLPLQGRSELRTEGEWIQCGSQQYHNHLFTAELHYTTDIMLQKIPQNTATG